VENYWWNEKTGNKTTLLHSHLLFSIAQSTQKNQKRVHSNALTKKRKLNEMLSIKELAAYNSVQTKAAGLQ
jgi:hypothetical protein